MNVPTRAPHLVEEEQQKLVDMESVARTAIERVEQSGILFVDEIDRSRAARRGTARMSAREGVQRDILPIVEGTTVKHQARHGPDRSRAVHRAGAFHVSKPSDLIPELQGRFPIRVELDALGRDESSASCGSRGMPSSRSTRRCSPPRAWTSGSPTMPSSGWRIWRPWSTSGWRTSAPAAYTPLMEKLLDRGLVRRARPLRQIDYD